MTVEHRSTGPQDGRAPSRFPIRSVLIGAIVLASIVLVGAVTWWVVRDDDGIAQTKNEPLIRGEPADVIVHFAADPSADDMNRLIMDVGKVSGVAAAEFSPASVITGVAPGADTIEVGEAVIGVRIEDDADAGRVVELLNALEGVEKAELK